MSTLAPLLEAFFRDRLIEQRQASPNTVAAYRDAFRLLLTYAREHTGTEPSQLALQDLDAALIGGFLTWLETDRKAGIRTRNARLSAIRAFYRYAAYEAPEHSALIQRVLAIPAKRYESATLAYLSEAETEALLAAPDTATWTGRRDHAMLLVALVTGLRASELTSLTRHDVQLGTSPYVTCTGKGRKKRLTPLDKQTRETLKKWLLARPQSPEAPLFPGPQGQPLTRDAVRKIVARHAATAATVLPGLRTKHVTPHTLRHTCAMRMLHAGIDIATIAIWLGHENIRTVQIYLHADLSAKESALDRTVPPSTRTGRFEPADELLAVLESL
jgi:site-specific recombinase XerD